MILLVTGCMTLDPFFFNGEVLTQYGFPTEVIPEDRVEEVVFDSGEETLYGMWAWQYQPRKHPTLVYFHGNASHMDEYMPRVEVLWNFGYNVFQFDYRGYGRSTGSSSHDSAIEDGHAAVDQALLDAPWLREGSNQLAYVGLSLGGFVSLHTALDTPPYALVTQDMFASASDLVELNFGLDSPDGWLFEGAFDNAGAASQLEVPYLVLHGADDSYIKPDNAERVYAAANEPKRLFLVPGADHAEMATEQTAVYEQELVGWLETWAPVDPEE
ncbi:MAG TPA: alpha/beta fold hydrolase [Myxococcota bacterium]|nr:alpha/beta fold hydrolase [Myxococcota bacterium]